MLLHLNNRDTKAMTDAYYGLSSFIAYISTLSGIPPGTTPSPATNTEVARAYRHTITSLAKLGLSNDIIKDFQSQSHNNQNSSSSTSSVISDASTFSSIVASDRKYSLTTDMSANEQDATKLAIKEVNILTEKTKMFIKVFRKAAGLEDDDLSQYIFDHDNFRVQKFRAGTWYTASINMSGESASSDGSHQQSLFHLEAFETVIPLDQEAVAVLDHQRNMVVTLLRQIFNVIDLKSSKEDSPFHEDKRQLVLSSLTSLVSLVSNMSNLVESLDLSIFQSHNRRLSSVTMFSNIQHGSTSTSSTGTNITPLNGNSANTSLPPLYLLCDFLEVKQALYDDILSIVTAVQQSDINDQGFIDSLAESLEATKLNTKKMNINDDEGVKDKTEPFQNSEPTTPLRERSGVSNRESNENVIKKCALEFGVTIDSLVQFATALSEERTAMLSFSRTVSNPEYVPATKNVVIQGEVEPIKVTGHHRRTDDDNMPWYLKTDFDDGIIYDSKNSIRGGTLTALVEVLTNHKSINANFNTTILLTFRSFTTPEELFQELVKRFNIQPPEGLSKEEFSKWTEYKQKLIRLRIINVIKKWLEDYWFENTHNNKNIANLLKAMLTFIQQINSDSSDNQCSKNGTGSSSSLSVASNNNPSNHEMKIINLIDSKLNYDNDDLMFSTTRKKLVQNLNLMPNPTPILPKNLKKLKLFDIDPLELARQLTLREFKLFQKITPFELLTRKNRKKKENQHQFINAFIQNSNGLTNWVSFIILKFADMKKRAHAIRYFVNVAEHCRQLNNFSSMMAVISALYSATIHRMKKTWASVSPRTMELLDSMNKLMNSSRNFNEYRDILRMVQPPVIPFFGVYLSDLTFVEDGNPDFLPIPPNSPLSLQGKPIINYAKRLKCADIIREIMQYQIKAYNFQEVPAIQALLDTGFAKAPGVDLQYEISLNLEPRERTNERMARLLEETGYL